MKPLVRVTSHVSPPLTVTYTLAEFLEANIGDMDSADIVSLVKGEPIRMGGGAAPIVDVVPKDAPALLAENERLRALLRTFVEHASEMYPHFESIRGQREIAEARAALAATKG